MHAHHVIDPVLWILLDSITPNVVARETITPSLHQQKESYLNHELLLLHPLQKTYPASVY